LSLVDIPSPASSRSQRAERDVERPHGSPVDVLVTIAEAEDVRTVQVEAVLALAEGGYAVVVITGDVAEGDEVVVP
jgi:phosphoserine phosphatase